MCHFWSTIECGGWEHISFAQTYHLFGKSVTVIGLDLSEILVNSNKASEFLRFATHFWWIREPIIRVALIHSQNGKRTYACYHHHQIENLTQKFRILYSFGSIIQNK